jgi:DNA-directed RNA polymerase specialized sigma24 family protein
MGELGGGSAGRSARHVHVSTRSQPKTRDPEVHGLARRAHGVDPAEEVALVARAKRELLLRVHRHRLRKEDLEDCYSQATVELIANARKGARFSSRLHLANVIEQRFLSRVRDRRRALSGRSPMQAALEASVSLGGLEEAEIEIVDVRADPEQLAIVRQELPNLQALARDLTSDQQLALACQVGLQMEQAEFCRRFGWSEEKYRKVAQRARKRLRQLMADRAMSH